MIADFDDTHFCLKCESTILGLDNYISHRKSGCSKTSNYPPKSPLPSQLLPPDEIGLKADDFFSSLELRSSLKKPEQQSTSGKHIGGILTRSKTTAVIQATTSKDQQETPQSKSGKNVWIGGHQLKELGSGDNQSKLIKAVADLERRKDDPPRIGVYADSDEDSDEYDYEDQETSEDEDIPPRNHTGGKWKPTSPIQWSRETRDWNMPPPTFTGGKWKPNPSKSHTSPPPSYTKGKWKPTEFDSVPPASFTGSKWVAFKKQDDVPPPRHTKGKWKPKGDLEEDSSLLGHTKGKWKPQCESDEGIPPPTHTKGKWKPRTTDDDITGSSQSKGNWKEKTEMHPPSSYTKGKWKPRSESESSSNIVHSPKNPEKLKFKSDPRTRIKKKSEPEDTRRKKGRCQQNDSPTKNSKIDLGKPSTSKKSPEDDFADWISPHQFKAFKITDESPFRISSGTVQYWCSPCNRRLASKIVYERHLKSALHYKRTRPDGEFDEGAFIKTKKIKEPSVVSNQNAKAAPQRKRKRKKIFEVCTVCHSKVNKYLMGKHLISHYHCRKGDIATDVAKTMVLENIYGIVLESPFQCCVCKFYCNTHADFLNHWRSELHQINDTKYLGYFFCTFCKHCSDTSEIMFDHLNSEEHLEVVSVINKSVPITIKKIREMTCLTCGQKFTLNIQLLNHCRKYGHDETNVDVFRKTYGRCKDCDLVFKTPIALQRHRKTVHRQSYFFCSTCNLRFEKASDAKEHRKSLKHRYASMEKKKPEGSSLRRMCKYCDEYFSNFLLLKEHLQREHPEHKIRCPHCGASFTVTQELTNHLRSKSCNFEETSTEENCYRCEKCPFSSNSTSELLFHIALHSDPIIIYPLDSDGNEIHIRAIPRYKCPVCEKIFPKSSLHAHLRQHTQERPYVCKLCNASFGRRNNLLFHVKNHKKRTRKVVTRHSRAEKAFLCSTCGAGFSKKFTLQQHMLVHTGKLCKCPEIGCFYKARKLSEIKEHFRTHCEAREFCCNLCDYKGKTKSQLKRHLNIHDEIKKFQCNICPFTARTAAHLKRHARLHTGAKPYNCPHCDYKCNTLENLRKHVLSTTKHPGKSVYECKFCVGGSQFQVNFAKEFKNHLMVSHSEVFGNGKDAASYIAGIYKAQEDSTYLTDIIDTMDDRQNERSALEQSVKQSDQAENILKLKTSEDPIVTQLLSSSEQPVKDRTLDHMLPMFIIPKDDGGNIEIAPDSWSLIERYDVEESGTLVPFQSDGGDVLFQEHF
ncbi:zinc finger protein 729-like [Cylas formicarius]|uniref:zinc finger protein 729-like n=1 Tax=Cylas formicarius TaxID=197179 RepID=UPI0029588843|nr:zinc finger protein 729-like [Cylas formicarius]XP_060528625.1 zinc finger protein 729-like [Cylas formicarius]